MGITIDDNLNGGRPAADDPLAHLGDELGERRRLAESGDPAAGAGAAALSAELARERRARARAEARAEHLAALVVGERERRLAAERAVDGLLAEAAARRAARAPKRR